MKTANAVLVVGVLVIVSLVTTATVGANVFTDRVGEWIEGSISDQIDTVLGGADLDGLGSIAKELKDNQTLTVTVTDPNARTYTMTVEIETRK